MNTDLYQYILGIADNSLILGQRMGELCGHGPSLETDIACTNILVVHWKTSCISLAQFFTVNIATLLV